MWLIVGLGNPTVQHAKQRHNIGFMAADAIAEKWQFPDFQNKHKGLFAQHTVADQKVCLLKPLTYMNLSGEPVAAAAGFYKIPSQNIIVFYDELDLAAGKVRVKLGGGAAGHNGIRSMDKHVGTEYWRVRLGIGHPGDKQLVHSHVLGNFQDDEFEWRDKMLTGVANFLPDLLAGLEEKSDAGLFMTRVSDHMKP